MKCNGYNTFSTVMKIFTIIIGIGLILIGFLYFDDVECHESIIDGVYKREYYNVGYYKGGYYIGFGIGYIISVLFTICFMDTLVNLLSNMSENISYLKKSEHNKNNNILQLKSNESNKSHLVKTTIKCPNCSENLHNNINDNHYVCLTCKSKFKAN
jgi:DNA-directed RNA polymerase subunit RPC12/RpoP